MTKAPERIWAARSKNTDASMWWPDEYAGGVEYIRADTIPALLAAERGKALRMAAEVAYADLKPKKPVDDWTDYAKHNYAAALSAHAAILALIDTETDPQPDLSGTSEPQDAHNIEDARAMAEFACDVIDANSQCDESACCDGRECCCGGETVHEHMKAMIRAKAGIEQEGET